MTVNQRVLRGLIRDPGLATPKVKRRIAKNPDYLIRFRELQSQKYVTLATKKAEKAAAETRAAEEEKRLKALAEAERLANLQANEAAAKKKAERKIKAAKPLIVEVKS